MFVLILLGAILSAAPIHIPKIRRAPTLQDFLTQRPREAEAKVESFTQRDPHDGEPATRKTAAYLSHDDRNLYVVFECEADPKALRARLSKRDAVFADETVNVMLDTFHDRRRAYMFFANPLGVQLDGVTTEGQADDYTFDTVWHSEGRITATGYIVLMAIPFKSLRFHAGGTWGIALTRYIPVSKEFASYPYITQRIEGFVEQFAAVEKPEGVSPGRNIQLNPYGFLSRQSLFDPDTVRRIPVREQRGGLDAKVVLGESLTLDVTANPDFSQVESDEPQVTINRRFENFFPERRPFFIENAGYFETPETLFFSRRIADPQFGARLTGKAGKWAVGLLGMDDNVEGGRAKIGVLRVQREVWKQSSIGAMMTTRDEFGFSNRVLSVDTRLRLTPNLVLTGQAVRSLDSKFGNGSAAFAEVRYANRHLQSTATYRDRSPEFNAELGFIPRVDIRQTRHQTTYRWRPSSGRVLSFGPGLYSALTYDHAGRLQDWSVEVPFRIEFTGPTAVEVSRFQAYEFFRGRGFRKDGTYASISTDYWRHAGLRADFTHSAGINYFPGQGRQPFAARQIDASFGVTLRPTRRSRLDETYIYSRLAATRALYNNHIFRTKLNYQFTRTLSLRFIADYNGVLPDESLIDLQRRKRVTFDGLFTRMLHPGTALHAGYTNQRRLGTHALDTDSQIFVKLSYLLRF